MFFFSGVRWVATAGHGNVKSSVLFRRPLGKLEVSSEEPREIEEVLYPYDT